MGFGKSLQITGLFVKWIGQDYPSTISKNQGFANTRY